MMLEQQDIHMQKRNVDTDFIPFVKFNWKWIIDLKVKCKTIKVLEDNLGKNLDDLGYSNAFLYTTPKAQNRNNEYSGLH